LVNNKSRLAERDVKPIPKTKNEWYRYGRSQYLELGEIKEKIIIGDAGTIIAVDTQCLHKGKSLIQGSRLLAQFQYATDFLGHNPNYVHCAKLSNECKKEIFKYPKVFNKFKN
jgi:hypothetical protein